MFVPLELYQGCQPFSFPTRLGTVTFAMESLAFHMFRISLEQAYPTSAARCGYQFADADRDAGATFLQKVAINFGRVAAFGTGLADGARVGNQNAADM